MLLVAAKIRRTSLVIRTTLTLIVVSLMLLLHLALAAMKVASAASLPVAMSVLILMTRIVVSSKRLLVVTVVPSELLIVGAVFLIVLSAALFVLLVVTVATFTMSTELLHLMLSLVVLAVRRLLELLVAACIRHINGSRLIEIRRGVVIVGSTRFLVALLRMLHCRPPKEII